jgi:hypothetical protein
MRTDGRTDRHYEANSHFEPRRKGICALSLKAVRTCNLGISLDFENYETADVRKETILKSFKVITAPSVLKLLKCCFTLEIRTDIVIIQGVCNVIMEWFVEITGKNIERM